MTEQSNLIVIQVHEVTSLNGAEENMLTFVTLEMSCSCKTKGKRTISKRCTLVDKVVSYGGKVINFETTIYL